MRGFLLAVAVATPIVLAGPARAAPKAVVLQPSSAWVINYADERCQLTRTFGSQDDVHLLKFEQGAPGDMFGFTVAGSHVRSLRPNSATVRFGANPLIEHERPFAGRSDPYGRALIFSSIGLAYGKVQDDGPQAGLPRIDPALAQQASFVELASGSRTLRLQTGDLAKPMAALNSCTADLVRSWGLDLEQQQNRAKGPFLTNEGQIIRKIVGAYPTPAERMGEQGITTMRVMVDAAGKATHCHIEKMTETKSLESPACRFMDEAVFEPALGQSGAPIPSYYTVKIVYKMS